MPGPRPQPTKLKALRGNPSKRRLPRDEPQPPEFATPPEPPAEWGDTWPEAAAVWRDHAPRLPLRLTVADLEPFRAYCTVVARLHELEADLRQHGTAQETPQGRIKRPELGEYQRALADLRAFSALFGLSPADRVRLATPAPAKAASKWAGLVS